MNKLEWKIKYIKRLIEQGNLSHDLAEETYQCGEHDYNEDPIDTADEDLSYWID